MAQALRFVCDHCERDIQSWSDGNPYFIDADGKKQYAYHPDHENLERCIGNDTPHLCLGCGLELKIDSLAPVTACPECKSAELRDTYDLAGCRCPYCREGDFSLDPDYQCIS
jgi:DNA-directed RNA polymerase subunit RPC12/RpoP